MEITPLLAQPIVQRVMESIENNVNIMNHKGIIVGSGDPSRLHTIHDGARQAIARRQPVTIWPDDVDRLAGVRPGVNLPIYLDGEIAGVVGITGDPREVRPLGRLIQVTVELMLKQAQHAEAERVMTAAREHLLRELLAGTAGNDAAADDAGTVPEEVQQRADRLGVPIRGHLRILVCSVADPAHKRPEEYPPLEAAAHALADTSAATSGTGTAAWLPEVGLVCLAGGGGPPSELLVQRAWNRVRSILGGSVYLTAGGTHLGVAGLQRSYQQALITLAAARRLYPPGAYTWTGHPLAALLATIPPREAEDFQTELLGPLRGREGEELRRTLTAWMKSGLSVRRAAEQLGVHRHTLVHRLNRIQALSGRDPRQGDQAVVFYLALLLEQLTGHSGH